MRSALALLCATLACSTEPERELATEQPEVGPLDPPAEPPAWGTPLIRGEGHDVRITEVWLDELAGAALSLDGFGQVRLWPTLAEGAKPKELAPLRLPIHEPGSLSFTRTKAGFVIAVVDTARSGRVLEVRIDEAGEAQMLERFTTSPTDPLLELHVLAGGERLLALGADHRIRLYDGQGVLLSELREHGFIPWQLRVQANRIVAVLGGPTRVQTIELRDDRLARVGELRTTLLDRGANHNDLQLTPDGQRVAVFRRKDSQSRKWSLQLIDLDDGEVRLITGKVVGDIRPRFHLVDDHRALLEDGTGVGYWIDLDQGVARQPGFVPPKDFDDLPNAAHVEARQVPLPHSKGRERWHASVVAGFRAVPGDRQLVLDAVDAPDHRRLGHTTAATSDVVLSRDGSRVAWEDGQGIVVDELAEPASTFVVPWSTDGWYDIVAFIDDEHLLVTSSPRALILAWRTGEQAAEQVVTAHFDQVGWRTSPSAGLEYALRTFEDELLLVVDRRFAAGDPANIHAWAWIGDRQIETPSGHEFHGKDPQHTKFYSKGPRNAVVTIRDRSGQEREIDLPRELDLMAPSPCGRWLAIVENNTHRNDYGKHVDPYIARLVVYALGDLTAAPRRVWAMPMIDPSDSMDVAWSADGERLAIAERSVGGLVVTASGEVVFERRHGELVDVRAPDEPPARE